MTYKKDLTKVNRAAVLALAWQVSNAVERSPGKYNANPKLLERVSDEIRTMPADITHQDALEVAMAIEGAEDDDGISMFTVTFALYEDIIECFTPETKAYYIDLRSNDDRLNT